MNFIWRIPLSVLIPVLLKGTEIVKNGTYTDCQAYFHGEIILVIEMIYFFRDYLVNNIFYNKESNVCKMRRNIHESFNFLVYNVK